MRHDFLFLIFVMALTTGLVFVNQSANSMFGDSVHLRRQNEQLNARLAREELQQKLLSQQLFDYGQSVASVLSQEKNLKDWKTLSLLEVSRLPASTENPSESTLELNQGKGFFNDGKYAEAVESFLNVEKRFPGSPASLEARFLRTESYYLLGQMDQCLSSIEDMMNFYPEHPMTGYLMLRLSQILQYRKRTPEAIDVLKMVQKNFPREQDLKKQASLLEQKYRTL